MKKCKNIECSNETLNNRVYCSLKCRNYYVNKYLRDYTKNGESISNKAKNSYLLSPKKCKNAMVLLRMSIGNVIIVLKNVLHRVPILIERVLNIICHLMVLMF
jgi:hypothetical protein